MKYLIEYPEDAGKKFEEFKYPAGESQVRIKKEEIGSILSADEVLVVARVSNSSHIPGLALLTDALQKITRGMTTDYTLILPYLPYSRADRRFTEGDCFGLKTFGKFINDLGYGKVFTLDVHSPHARKYISNLFTISPIDIIKTVLELVPKGTTILLPDEGAKRYELEKYFPKTQIFYAKKNRNPVTGEIVGTELPSGILQPGDDILIVDDICDGGRTFVEIAKQLPNTNLYLYVTHGIFSKGFKELLHYFLHIYTTDSFPYTESLQHPGYVTRVPSLGHILNHVYTHSNPWGLMQASNILCQSS